METAAGTRAHCRLKVVREILEPPHAAGAQVAIPVSVCRQYAFDVFVGEQDVDIEFRHAEVIDILGKPYATVVVR